MEAVRDALIVAVGTFDDAALSRLRSPSHDASALADVLADPEIGGFTVRSVVDAPLRGIAQAAEQFFARRRPDDLLLFYLSSHGVKDDDGRLYFAARDTEKKWLASTAMPASLLQDLMNRCRARSVVLLLDSCYSGAFIAGSKGDRAVHLKEELTGHGRAVLTASNAIEYAWEGDRLTGEGTPSVFTAAIVDGLRSGDADRDKDGKVSVDDLSIHVYDRVRALGSAQTPLRWMSGVASNVYVARVPHRGAPGAAGGPPPAEIAALVRAMPIADDEQTVAALDALRARLDEAVAQIVAMLGGTEPADRAAAASVAAEFGAEAVDPVLALLRDADDGLFRVLCAELGSVGPSAVPLLLAGVDRLDAGRRGALVRAITGIGTPAAVFGLTERGLLPESWVGRDQ